MTSMSILRIVAVVMLGAVVAISAGRLIRSLTGSAPLAPRAQLGEALTGVGAFAIGWGFLPGGPAERETVLVLAGVLLWGAGVLTAPGRSGDPAS